MILVCRNRWNLFGNLLVGMFLFRYLKKLSIALEFVDVGERLEASAYHKFGCFLIANKIFEELLRSRWVKLLEKNVIYRMLSGLLVGLLIF